MTLAKIAKNAKAGKEILGFGTEILIGVIGDLCERISSVSGFRIHE
jgi:hypothetical protein